jgi:hypothetical protein
VIVAPGSTSVSVTVTIVDDSGLAVTGLVAATFPTTVYERVAEAAVPITLSDLAAVTSAYSSGGVKEVGGGDYRLDAPDLAFATATRLRVRGEASGKHLLCPTIDVQYVQGNVKQVADVSVYAAQLASLISDYAGGNFAVGDVNGDVNGDLLGKVLGASLTPIVGQGVWALDGSGNAIAPAATALSTAQWTNARASLLDNLTNLDAAISSLNNLSALVNLYGSPLLEIPDSSTTQFAFTLVVRDNEGKLVNLDANPTVAAANAVGTDRSANLSAVSHPATGRYTFTYGVASTAAEESLRVTVSGTVSAEARYVEWVGAVVNYDSLTAIAAIKAKTDTLPASPAAAGDAMTLTGGERTAVAAALLDLADGVESGKTPRQALRLMAAALAGKRANAGTDTETYYAIGNPTTVRIVGNQDSAGDGTPTLTP